jgi:Ca2+/H+ antiporter
MTAILKALRHSPLYGLLIFVPVVLIAHHLRPEAHTALFVLSVVAIVPLAVLLSHSTESVAWQVLMVLPTTLTVSGVVSNGQSAWYSGVPLLAVYAVFAVTLYLIPG